MRSSLTGLLTIVTGFALTAYSANAADLPYRGTPASPLFSPAPAFSWTGLYTGLNAGYGWSDSVTHRLDPDNDVIEFDRSGGFVGGGQIGYNFQIGKSVLGVETDLQYAAIGNKSGLFGTAYFPDNSDGYFGTVRARLGFAVDRTLVYGTGGIAYGDIGGNKAYDVALDNPRSTDPNWGWTLGGGIEYSITNNITARLDGLYVNLDTRETYEVGTGTITSPSTEFGVIRTGLSYKFGK
jgi:outer membrane immunogenic protein